MPSLSVVVPVYGETVIRSWHQMMETNASGLCNFAYMVENRLDEFLCLLKQLPDAEAAVLRRLIDVIAVSGDTAFVDACPLSTAPPVVRSRPGALLPPAAGLRPTRHPGLF